MNDVLSYAFGGIVGLLLTASGVLAGLMRARPDRNFRELKLRIQTWWWLAGLLFLALGFNRTVAVVVLGLVSFMAFKEFISLIPIRAIDTGALLLAYLAIPVQYLWVGRSWYGMFIIFIPVYVFLLLPLHMVIAGETKGFLRAAGTIHWGLMTTVFSLSHLAYLLVLPAHPGAHGPVRGEMLVFYLLVLTQLNDVASCGASGWGGTRWPPPSAPTKRWRACWVGWLPPRCWPGC